MLGAVPIAPADCGLGLVACFGPHFLWTFYCFDKAEHTLVLGTLQRQPPLGRLVPRSPALLTSLVPEHGQPQAGSASISCLLLSHEPLNRQGWKEILKVWQLRTICLVLLIRS